MDRAVGAELAQAEDPAHGARVLEQRVQLVSQSSGREVAHEAHLDAAAREPRRVLLEPEPVPRLVADRAEDPRGVVDERQVVEHPQQACLRGPLGPRTGSKSRPKLAGSSDTAMALIVKSRRKRSSRSPARSTVGSAPGES